jgi:hypothetical protein
MEYSGNKESSQTSVLQSTATDIDAGVANTSLRVELDSIKTTGKSMTNMSIY